MECSRPMESAKLQIARSVFAGWRRGDYSSTDWAHPDIEWVIADGPTVGSWSGLTGMAHASRDFLGAWEEVRLEAEGYRELDGERILALVHQGARGKTSRLEVGASSAAVLHVRDGKVTKVVFYFDRRHAFTDLGLDAEGRSANS